MGCRSMNPDSETFRVEALESRDEDQDWIVWIQTPDIEHAMSRYEWYKEHGYTIRVIKRTIKEEQIA